MRSNWFSLWSSLAKVAAKKRRSRPRCRDTHCRLAVEQLEVRCVLSSFNISGSGEVPLDLGRTIHKGDIVKIEVPGWNLPDENDTNEGEPLVIRSDGGYSKTL